MLDLDADPTPGDPFALRELARRFLGLAADADQAAGRVRALSGDEAVATWVGQSGDAYRAEIGDFPGQLAKLSTSYGMAGRAVGGYASALDGAQAQADRALVAGREARARLTSADAGLSTATTAEAGAARTVSGLTGPSLTPPGGLVSPGATTLAPDPAAVAAAVRDHTAAQTRVAQARAADQAARADVDAARRLALAARGLREDAEQVAVRALTAASHAGIRNKSFWSHLGSAAARAWHATVAVCKVVVVVLAVVALVVGGPLVWGILLAASLVLLADTLDKYAHGQASLFDVGLAALACLPGGRIIGEGEDLIRLTSAARSLATRGETLLTAGRAIVRGFPEAARESVQIVKAVTPEGHEIITGISADAGPLRNLISRSVGDARAAGGGTTAESLA
ncbi:MAG: WXG100 family type VII secretion target, partial [Frankia sp.]